MLNIVSHKHTPSYLKVICSR